jgi:hypothetical protein
VAVLALLLLLLGSFAGLLTGRRRVALPFLAVIAPLAVVGGPEAGALGALAAAGFLAGVQLHQVVAEQYHKV